MISIAATRPEPSLFGIKRCENQRLDVQRQVHQQLHAALFGKKVMMRSSAWLALLACSVARHRCPVSANATACSIVSASRISADQITSGAWRSVFFSALCQFSVSTPTSRWVMMHLSWSCTYSTGPRS